MTASFPDSALSSPPIWLTTEDKEDILRLWRLCLSNTIRANRKRRLIMQMAVHHLLARRRLLCVCSLVMLLLSQRNAIARVPRRRASYTKKIPHVKHVYFVGEKHEPYILSSTAAILLSNTRDSFPPVFFAHVM